MVLKRLTLFICIFLLEDIWATDVVSGQEYCAEMVMDLDLPAGSCMMQGYLESFHYSEVNSGEVFFSLHDGQRLPLFSSYFDLPLLLRHSRQDQGHDAILFQLNQAFLLTALTSSQSVSPVVRVVYWPGPDESLNVLRLQMLHIPRSR